DEDLEFVLEKQMGITYEDKDLENSIREEQFDSNNLFDNFDNFDDSNYSNGINIGLEDFNSNKIIDAPQAVPIPEIVSEPETNTLSDMVESQMPDMMIESQMPDMMIESQMPDMMGESEEPFMSGTTADSKNLSQIPLMPDMAIDEDDMPPIPDMSEAFNPNVLSDKEEINLHKIPKEVTSAENLNLVDILKTNKSEDNEVDTEKNKDSDFASTQIVNRKKSDAQREEDSENFKESELENQKKEEEFKFYASQDIEEEVSGSEELDMSDSTQDEIFSANANDDDDDDDDDDSGTSELDLKQAIEEEKKRRKPSAIEPTQAIKSVNRKSKKQENELFIEEDDDDEIPAELAKTRKTQMPEPKSEAKQEPVAAPPQPKTRKKISRETTLRYYKKMVPFRTFPLNILFSAKKIQKIQSETVTQTQGKSPVQVTEEKPCIKVVASFPGCLVEPRERIVDISPQNTSLKMWVTPMAEGEIEQAGVELWYENKCVEIIPVKTTVESQKSAKISALLGIITPFISIFFELFGSRITAKSNILQKIVPFISNLVNKVGGALNFGLIIGGAFMFLAIILYFSKKSKKGKPLTNTVEFA
ncbi:MAG: hypothetical protein ABIC57_03175, partial [bacterium]